MKELWKDIKNYEGLYQVSNRGRVRNSKTGRIRKHVVGADGYCRIILSCGGTDKGFCVHRLVAQTFVDNPDSKPEINHIDENKSNNNADNLIWCTAAENANWGNRNQKIAESKSKPIIQYSLDGDFINRYKSAVHVNELFGYDRAFISKACNGIYDKAYNYVWRFAEQRESVAV